MTGVIEAKHLRFSYDDKFILSHVEFSVKGGDFIAVVGANGAGKSTLIKIITGELCSYAGSLTINGIEVSNMSNWECIGYVPQNASHFRMGFPATVMEIVSSGLVSQHRNIKKTDLRDRVINALDRVHMSEHINSMVGTLSGGQRQRIMIARAIVREPSVLILDEPTTGIDSESFSKLYEVLRGLNVDSGMTIFIVTHDVSKTMNFYNRIFCMNGGTVVELSREQAVKDFLHNHHSHNIFCEHCGLYNREPD